VKPPRRVGGVDVDVRARLGAVGVELDQLGALDAHLPAVGERRRAPAAGRGGEGDLVAGGVDPRRGDDLLGQAMQLLAALYEAHGCKT
jgi:hypothetical protein